MDDVPRLTCEELKQLLEKKENIVVIDTRKNSAYDSGHIARAVNIYYNPAGDPMERQLMLSALPADRLVVFYCDCIDDTESSFMAQEVLNLGYDADKVRVLGGGLLRWLELGYPTEKSGS